MTQQSGVEEIRPVDEIHEDLTSVDEEAGDLIEEGVRRLDLAVRHDKTAENPTYHEEIERLQDQVIKPLEKAKQDAIQTVDDLEAGKIDAAQAQKALEEINETVEDAKSTLEEVTVDELEDEDEDDEDE